MQPIDLTELPLNWQLARERFERDVRDDFFPDPFHNRDLFVAAKVELDSVFSLNDYRTEPAESWDVPKANFSLRHSINISAVDRLVYQALVDHLATICDPLFSERSYAFRLRGPEAAEMYKSFVEQKSGFDEAVRRHLLANHQALVVTIDVAQYFENIPIEGLKRKLIELTGAKLGHPTRAVIDVLIQCLSDWTPYATCGLPQNMFPSSFLGNAYLHSLDTLMLGAGFDYYRYMDDLRILVADEASARRSLKVAITHLRELELSVNGKKTAIVRPETSEWRDLTVAPDPSFQEIENVVKHPNLADLPACVTRLNEMLMRLVDAAGGNRRDLRFCLGRLTGLRRIRKVAVPEPFGYGPRLLQLVKWLPEETTYICDYFHAWECSAEALQTLSELLTQEPMCIYGWQNYRLWLLAAEKEVRTDDLIRRARAIITEQHEPAEVAGAAVFLGGVGDPGDLNMLGAMLRDGQHSVSVKRALCISIQELVEREPILARFSGSSATLSVLVRYLSRLRAPRYVARSRRVPLRRLQDEMPDNFS